MTDNMQLYREIYTENRLFDLDHKLPENPLIAVAAGVRKNSIAVEGGAFGDEGKGKIVDELCSQFARRFGELIVYRWNGGANAGHTIEFAGKRIALHQLPSGAFTPGATVILGKGMVVHPGDVVAEMREVERVTGQTLPARLLIDAMAVLALDTHRAFEACLKGRESGGAGATGRGISPAYADVLLRHPMRAGDLKAADWRDRLGRHYDLYAALISGLGGTLAETQVPSLEGKYPVGTKTAFLDRLAAQRDALLPYIQDVHAVVFDAWNDSEIPFVFEGAQAVGLDPRFGVYPDVTASDPTFGGILHSTEGIVHPAQIAVKAGAIKATYTSSVGTRHLPTLMDEPLASRIREDAHEYGATTRRPRDIAYIDLACLRFFAHASGMTHLVLTHLDIAYPDTPIRVCTHYTDERGQVVPYRPDQDALNRVTPHYLELPAWDGAQVRGLQMLEGLPPEAIRYVAFLSRALGVTPIFGTTGPQRDAILSWLP